MTQSSGALQEARPGRRPLVWVDVVELFGNTFQSYLKMVDVRIWRGAFIWYVTRIFNIKHRFKLGVQSSCFGSISSMQFPIKFQWWNIYVLSFHKTHLRPKGLGIILEGSSNNFIKILRVGPVDLFGNFVTKSPVSSP